MAATSFDKEKLSDATDGRGILITQVATAGDAIHTAVVGTAGDTWDEIFLQACNIDTVDRLLTIEYGGVSAPTDTIIVNVPFKSGLIVVVDGLILRNTLLVKAFAAAANVIIVHGYIHQIRP